MDGIVLDLMEPPVRGEKSHESRRVVERHERRERKCPGCEQLKLGSCWNSI
uniref:Uncharacterized protein n=1 Tax=Wuchereria bancrofti TaxID=6293 RepID=A0AAF5Q0L3_WUCBA